MAAWQAAVDDSQVLMTSDDTMHVQILMVQPPPQPDIILKLISLWKLDLLDLKS